MGGLQLDREHKRYYFAPAESGVGLSVDYRPLNRRRASRTVVWQPKKKSTGEARPYWYHRAVALKFFRTAERTWALSIRPELRITIDGRSRARNRGPSTTTSLLKCSSGATT